MTPLFFHLSRLKVGIVVETGDVKLTLLTYRALAIEQENMSDIDFESDDEMDDDDETVPPLKKTKV